MERTIDGIDYIAKSEVLRIIDEEACWAETMYKRLSPTSHEAMKWGARLAQLIDIRERLSKTQER